MSSAEMIEQHIEGRIAAYLVANNLPSSHNTRYDAAVQLWNLLMEMEDELPELFRRAYMAHLATILVEESLAALSNNN